MVEGTEMAHRSNFKIDLVTIDGEGEFPCPSCGETISPDDFTSVLYDIVDIKVKEDYSLEEISLLCKKCGSIIHLVGFDALEEKEYLDDLERLFDLGEYISYRVGLET